MGLSNGSAGLCAPLTILTFDDLTFDVKLFLAARHRYLKRFAQLPSSCSRYMSLPSGSAGFRVPAPLRPHLDAGFSWQ